MTRPGERLILCCTPFGDSWTWFVQELTAPDVRWRFFSDRAKYRFQHYLQRPNLNTPVAGLQTALAARSSKAALIITIDPRLSFWVALWCRVLRIRTPHFVFSFNFPELPHGWKRSVFRVAYKRIDAARVHSRMEIPLYHQVFAIPESRFRLGLWAMNAPEVTPGGPLIPGDYITAIGGNSRDYATLAEAGRLTPEIPQVWVVRPENLAGLDIPPHITVFSNAPYPDTMNYLLHSRYMALPLKGAEVPCGHVTLVSAMLLGKAILATDSAGVSDYVDEGVNGMLCRPHDAEHMAQCMRALWNAPAQTEQMGIAGQRFAQANCTEAHVREEMQAYLSECGLTA
jgi:Glycosyl transferases group 1